MNTILVERAKSGWDLREIEVQRSIKGNVQVEPEQHLVTATNYAHALDLAYDITQRQDLVVTIAQVPRHARGLRWRLTCDGKDGCGQVMHNTERLMALDRALVHCELEHAS